MNTDTVFVINQSRVPKIMQVTVENLQDSISVHGTVSVSNMAESIHYEPHLDSIINIGNKISEYGTGYSDYISQIAFPLIIAVFGFALPFLFSAINHVNNKYDSASIANMFKSSIRYKSFWWSITFNVGAMIIYGGLSLLPFDTFHHLIGIGFSYAFIGLSSWMVVTVFLLMQHCMIYTKPYSVIDEMKRRYIKEKEEAEKKDYRESKKYEKDGSSIAYSGGKVWARVGFMYRNAYSNNADANYIARLSDMCSYAIRKNDHNLYSSVWSKVYDIQNEEMVFDDSAKAPIVEDKAKNMTTNFLLNSCSNNSESSMNVEIQGSLIRTWVQCFATDKYPNHIDFILLMRALFEIAGKGNTSFIERYFADCKFSFRYVLSLPKVFYVKGGDNANRHEIEKSSLNTWNEICDYHFVLAAFAYYMGLKTLPKQILSEEFGIEILPRNRQELLLTYMRCKGNIWPDGGFNFMRADELYHRRVDPEFIDFFAVLLFALLDNSDANNYFILTDEKTNNKIKGYKTTFCDIGEKYKKDAFIKQNFNKICQMNFKKEFDDSLRILQTKPSQEAFGATLPKLIKQKICAHINNNVLQIKNFTSENMWGNNNDGNHEKLGFGACQIRFSKLDVVNWANQDILYHLRYLTDYFVDRAYYLYMKALLSLKCKYVKATPDGIADAIQKAVGDHPEGFVLIDYDSNIELWCSMQHKGYRQRKCEGVDYVMCTCIGYLKDTFQYKQLEGKAFLVRKSDLFVLYREAEGNVTVSFDDQSNYDSNCLDLIVTIDPKYVIKYNKNINITSFEVVPINKRK